MRVFVYVSACLWICVCMRGQVGERKVKEVVRVWLSVCLCVHVFVCLPVSLAALVCLPASHVVSQSVPIRLCLTICVFLSSILWLSICRINQWQHCLVFFSFSLFLFFCFSLFLYFFTLFLFLSFFFFPLFLLSTSIPLFSPLLLLHWYCRSISAMAY